MKRRDGMKGERQGSRFQVSGDRWRVLGNWVRSCKFQFSEAGRRRRDGVIKDSVLEFVAGDRESPDGLLETGEEFVLKGGMGEGDDEVVFGGVGREVGGGAEAVAAAVLGGTGFALGGAGSGGTSGVGAVGPDLGGRRHGVLLLLL